MRIPRRTGQFKKDVKLAARRGLDLGKLEAALSLLIDELPLDPGFRDHPLKAQYHGRRERHLEPDWLLIYQLAPGEVRFQRTGSHSDLSSERLDFIPPALRSIDAGDALRAAPLIAWIGDDHQQFDEGEARACEAASR